MGYLSAVAGADPGPRLGAPSWRSPTPDFETEAGEESPELEPTSPPATDREGQIETRVEEASEGTSETAKGAVADGPRFRLPSPRQRLAPASGQDGVTATGSAAAVDQEGTTDKSTSRVLFPEPVAPATPELAEPAGPPHPTAGDGPEQPPVPDAPRPQMATRVSRSRIAELRVPADAYPGDLSQSSPAAIRKWLSEHREVTKSDHEESPVDITIERLVFEQPPPRFADPEPRERVQARGFADYDSIRRR